MYKKFDDLLKMHQVSAYKVAKDTGISTATISAWKAGLYTPKVDKLVILAKYFGVSVEYFLEN